MPKAEALNAETRVLVVAPVGRDAALACAALSEQGIAAEECAGVEGLCREVERGAGAAFITREALTEAGARALAATLGAQAPWSDLPLIVLARSGAAAADTLSALAALGETGNVTFIERPAHIVTILSVVRSALRARLRQYEVRDHLDALSRAREEREQLLKSEQAARLNAEANSRLKDEFLATVSHELRTPLTAILGWAQLLRRGVPDEQIAAHALEVIERNGLAQLHLVEDLLDVSRIISGKLLLDVRPVDLDAVIGAALDAARPAAESKGIELRHALDAAAGAVLGDADRLQQIVWNLVNNAVKFTPAGGRVEVRLARAASGVEISVGDTGIGIEPEFLPHVFDRFRQADAATTRTYGGLGLGLAIVRQLTELHGGEVSADSAGVGRGTTFTIRLPLSSLVAQRAVVASGRAGASDPRGAEALDCESLTGVRVLVVDDEPDARELFARTLSECGAEALTAGSAAEALAAIESERPDVLLADIGMPGEDGYALIGKVRGLPPERGGRTPAAALTAYAHAEDRVRALRAGFQLHLPKPVTSAELVAAIANLAAR
ncbi:MAG TPA: hybrid sensor histidine kinase/response regulator [Pyrinomonadaceae bacterium]|jgi:signal transduction histidine kinase|nr:hybrid sensor histidine kinase/response regulator [Pyrinomonadaceae bacterium]